MTGSRRCVAPFRGCMQIGQRHRSSDFDIEQMELSKFYSPEFVQRIYVIRFAWTGDVNQMMPPEVSAISVLAHRYIAHGQKTFNLEVDLSHPHRGYHCLPVDHDAIHDRVDIQEHSVYARDLLDAEMFVREFNSIRTEYKTIRMLGNIVTCTLSRAFISNNNLVNCQQYICDLFDHLCPCCLGTFYQSGGVCAISRKLMCWECGAIKPHNACMARVQMKYINRAQPNPLMPLEKHLEFNRLLLPPRMSHAAISPAFACGAASSVPNS